MKIEVWRYTTKSMRNHYGEWQARLVDSPWGCSYCDIEGKGTTQDEAVADLKANLLRDMAEVQAFLHSPIIQRGVDQN